MQKNSNRRGLALGAIFALVASFFVSAPAQASDDGANIGIYPVAENGTTSSAFVGTLVDDFPIYAQAKPGNASLTNSTVIVKIEKTAGTNMDVVVSTSLAVVDASAATSTSPAAPSGDHFIQAGSTSTTVSAKINANGIVHLNFKASSASGLASWSAVTLKVTVFQDTQGGVSNDIINSDEWFTTQTISLVHPSAITRTLTADALAVGTTGVTVSSTVTGLNLANLSGGFRLAYSTSNSTSFIGAAAVSAPTAHLRAGVVSGSVAITPITGNESYQFMLVYSGGTPGLTSGALNATTTRVGAALAATATRATATALVVEVEVGANAVSASGTTTSGITYNVRPNQTYKVTITAMSNSATVSGEVVSVALTGPSGLSVDAGKTISIDGGAATTSYPSRMALTTGADGKVSFTLASTGVLESDNNFVATVTSAVSNLSRAVTLDPVAPGFVVENEYDLYSTTPGTAVNLNFTVEDRWGVVSSRTNQRIKLDATSAGFQGNPTVSYVAVVAGKATFAFTANPVTKTGSATVVASLQTLNADNGVWEDVANSSDTATVVVTSVANAFTGSALASVSASISYAVASDKYSWSATSLTIKSVNAGADIRISAPGVFFQNQADSKTYSATATVRANSSGDLVLKFASAKAGTHTISYSVGSVTTTSQLIITGAQVENARNIAVSTATLTPGQTNVVAGTLTDANGNPVATTADKKVSVEWTGKGLPFNVGSISTDEDGKFTFQVLVLAGETGVGTVKATFKPTTLAANDITVTKALTIVAPEAPVVPEINAVIGSFNGRVAVRVENAKGAVVSVKIGARWFKYTSLNDNYLFTRKSVTGRTLPVAVYVNGTLENVATITVK